MKEKLLQLYNFERVQKVCDIVYENSEFFALIGETGSGKSSALEYYWNKNSKYTKFLRVEETMNTKDFYAELAALYQYHGPRNSFAIMKFLKEYFKQVSEKELLIFDEGGRFKPSQYTILHELRDFTKENLGIVLSGPAYFVNDIEKWSLKGVKGIPEFFRRIQLLVEMKPLQRKEILMICKENGINDAELIQRRFISLDNVGYLTKSIKNYLKYENGLK